MIHLDTPKRFAPLVNQAREVARQVLRPISRQYDRAEHDRPVEKEAGRAGCQIVKAREPVVERQIGGQDDRQKRAALDTD